VLTLAASLAITGRPLLLGLASSAGVYVRDHTCPCMWMLPSSMHTNAVPDV
jgi:hypothetical protein